MASLIPNFEYDIFISYRHNDNLEGWVSDFVQNLEKELRSTLKDTLTIYFDKNPHDGLLETHHVDKSLEGKLKCLIFIPIISQTYCDSKSFAWQHEFCEFNKLSKEDQLGRDIKLSNGNVASRILPIKIHELDAEDKTTIENEIGGALRAIEFIYKEAGVNRPLKSTDDKHDNQNKTDYRNQVNKVANAIKELLSGIQHSKDLPKESNPKKTIAKPGIKKYSLAAIIVLLLSLAGFGLYYFGGFGNKIAPGIDRSIAVLPFEDMSPEHNQEYFADGLSEELLNRLAQIPELKVIGRTSSFQFKGKNEDLREIGRKLNVTRILEGSVQKSETSLRITAQLIDTHDGSHLWSKTYDRKFDDIFIVQDEIASAVVDALKINLLSNALPTKKISVSPDAYDLFFRGRSSYEKVGNDEIEKAIYWFKESIKLDSTFALPWTYLATSYSISASTANSPEFKLAKQYAEKALALDPTLSVAIVNMAIILEFEYDLKGVEEKIKLALKIDPTNPYVLRNAGRFYVYLGKGEESVSFCKRALQNDPIQPVAQSHLLDAYFYTGHYAEAEEIGRKELGGSLQYSFFHCLMLLEQGKIEKALKESSSVQTESFRLFALAAAKFKLGNKKEAEDLCDQLIEKVASYNAYLIAMAFAYGDAPDKVFAWLEKSYLNKEQPLVYVAVEPAFKKFRNEPRFRKLLQKMKFPD